MLVVFSFDVPRQDFLAVGERKHEFVGSFVVCGLDGVEEVRSLGEKLFHPFPGNQGIVDLDEFLLDACFEEHDGIVLVLSIVVALKGEASNEIF